MVQIKRISIKQTAKFFSVFYFLVSLIFVLPMFIFSVLLGSFGGKNSGIFGNVSGGIFFLLLPLLYALLGFVVVAIFAFVYNVIAKRVGGVEFELNKDIVSKDNIQQTASPTAPEFPTPTPFPNPPTT